MLDALLAYDWTDEEILRHGFLPTMRDYEVIVRHYTAGAAETRRVVLCGCAEVAYRLALPHGAFSMDDRLLSSDTTDAAEGFVWAVASASIEVVRAVVDSPRAADWHARLGMAMYELCVATNVYTLTAVCHAVTVAKHTAK